MTLNHESKYPSLRTYVVKLRNDARPEALAGRIENVVTGRQRAFESESELIESLVGDLAAQPPGDHAGS